MSPVSQEMPGGINGITHFSQNNFLILSERSVRLRPEFRISNRLLMMTIFIIIFDKIVFFDDDNFHNYDNVPF